MTSLAVAAPDEVESLPAESLNETVAIPAVPAAKKADQIAGVIALTFLFACPALLCALKAVVNDPDIWWHMRTGQWILQHHAVPRVDPFSAQFAGKPWQAYSWLYEVLVYPLFQHLGPLGIVGYSAGMVLAITVALWHLVKRLQSDFSVVALLVFTACYSFGHLFTPRPWLFTILFFVLEIDILMQARRTGRTRELLCLPLLFALWSNIHIQFIDGLLVLVLALAEAVVTRRGIGEKTKLSVGWAAAALGGSIVGTFANPFGWHIYRVAYDLASQAGVMNKIAELQAIPFRNLADYSVLLLTVGASAALAWQRRFLMFEIGLLLFGVVLSFRSQRDVWVIGTAAAAIIASAVTSRQAASHALPRSAAPIAILAAALAVLAGFPLLRITNAKLEKQIANTLPVNAVHAIQARGYSGPLYNDFNWGGYLTWALRMPVSLDGRAAFYGDTVIDRSVATWGGQPDWASDPQLRSAGLVLGPANAPLTQLLRMDPGFQLVFEDKVAAVFIARK